MKLTIVLATRNRPELLTATIEKTIKNIRRPDTTFLICCDHDDLAGIEAARKFEPAVKVSVKEREDTLGAKYNRVLTEAPADVYLVMVDYAPHVTPGFDAKILEAASLFPDGIGVVYNHMANLSFPVINAITHKLTEKMGFIYPPYFPYWFVDHWLDDIARMTGRIAVADVTVETDKRPGTMDRREPGFWAALYDAGIIVRRRCVRDIIQSPDFQSPDWLKKMLLGSMNLVEERSLMVNQAVRDMAPQMGEGPPVDDRYRRVKSEAETLFKEWAATIHQEIAENRQNTPFGLHHPAEFMWFLSKAQGAGSVLEVGSQFGQSLKMLGNVAREGARICSIDGENRPQLGKVAEYLKAKGRDVFVQNHLSLSYIFDAVFLNRASTRADWEAYGKLGKLVAIHNINCPGHEAQKLWSEIKAKGLKTDEKVESQRGIGLVFQDAA